MKNEIFPIIKKLKKPYSYKEISDLYTEFRNYPSTLRDMQVRITKLIFSLFLKISYKRKIIGEIALDESSYNAHNRKIVISPQGFGYIYSKWATNATYYSAPYGSYNEKIQSLIKIFKHFYPIILKQTTNEMIIDNLKLIKKYIDEGKFKELTTKHDYGVLNSTSYKLSTHYVCMRDLNNGKINKISKKYTTKQRGLSYLSLHYGDDEIQLDRWEDYMFHYQNHKAIKKLMCDALVSFNKMKKNLEILESSLLEDTKKYRFITKIGD